MTYPKPVLDVLTAYCEEKLGYTPVWRDQDKRTRVEHLYSSPKYPNVIFDGFGGFHVVKKIDLWAYLDASGVSWRRAQNRNQVAVDPDL